MNKPSTTSVARLIEWLNTAWTVVADKPPAEPAKVVDANPGTEPAPKIPP